MDCRVMSTKVVFTLVVCKVFLPRVVFDVKSPLFDYICNPKETHFHRARSLLLDSVIRDAYGGLIVAMYCVGGWGWPISSSVSLKIVTCLQFRKRAPSLASNAEATTKRNIAHRVKKAPFNLMGLVGSVRQPMKKCPQAQLWAFASERYEASEGILRIMSEA
jgi:hypothetical protein